MRLVIILAIFLAASTCSALEIEQVSYDYNAPGSLKIRYTGLRKILIDEVRDLLEDEWRSDAETLFNSGQISLSHYRKSTRQLSDVRKQYDLNGNWWQRTWLQSIVHENGGAPPVQKFIVGRTGDIIDLGIAKVNENFKFKIKEYTADITNEWRFKFKPRITANTNDIISRAVASFVFEYSSRGTKHFRLVIDLGFKRNFDEFVEFRIEMFKL